MKTLSFFCAIFLAFGAVSVFATGQLMNYNIEYRSANVRGGGTNNLVYIKLVGERGTIDYFRLSGDKDSGKTNSMSKEASSIGRIRSITIDLHYHLADNWYPEWLKITVDDGGYYEFQPRTWLGATEKSFSPSFEIYPDYTETGDGKVMISPKIYTVVHGYDNLQNSSDVPDGFQYTETWTEESGVTMAESTSNSAGAAFTISYSSPETIYGSMSATAETYFEQVVSREKSQTDIYIAGSEYSWSFGARAYTYRFQRRSFKIETGYNRYKMGDKWIYIRKLNARIEPVGSESLEIPFRAEGTGAIIPYSWYELEQEWLPYMDASERDRVLAKKNAWLQAGWVFEVPSSKVINWQKRQLTYRNVSFANSGKNQIKVLPGEEVSLSFDWNVKVTGDQEYCPNCLIQFYVGIKGAFTEAFAHNIFSYPADASGNKTVTFTAPANPGTYYITNAMTLKLRPDNDVQKHSDNFQNAIAIVKVQGLSDDMLPTPIYKPWSERNVMYTNVSLNRTSKNAIAVNPGQEVSLSFDWEVAPTGATGYCPGCIVQFYVGMNGVFSECFYSGVITPTSATSSGEKQLTFRAPDQPGFYFLTQAMSLERQCSPNANRHQARFSDAIAIIQVRNSSW
jgi:hypothetical protein